MNKITMIYAFPFFHIYKKSINFMMFIFNSRYNQQFEGQVIPQGELCKNCNAFWKEASLKKSLVKESEYVETGQIFTMIH